ncbi:hypothetical protein SCORR_v1c05180 [Spiroplasma corruscae]|uniref:MOLPALP family lipoprotein n=1 Tax=Spiroplasma corruscae TaxID=216934 RepID=A0A222EP73_9MOLU|nr:lipoprotein [Spiroplasma corruscae]ASP28290.1 hypothetical protein SCORR_v1c05180 [Spiroplasma corruscae]
MKKLLSILGVISLVGSTTTYAISCGNGESQSEENGDTSSNKTKSEANILSQYAKSLMVNQYSMEELGISKNESMNNYHFSPSDYFELAKNEQISSLGFDTDISSEYKKDSNDKLSVAFGKYFDEDLVKEKTSIGSNIYKDGVLNSKSFEINSIVETVLGIATKAFSDPNNVATSLPDLFKTLYSFQGMIQGFLNGDTLTSLKSILSTKLLNELKDAFAPITENTYYEAIQNSIIGLAGAFDGALGGSGVNPSDFNTASKSVANSINDLVSGNKSINFSLDLIQYLPRIVKFVVVLANYLDSFTKDEIISSSILTADTIVSRRNTKPKDTNSFDFKKWLNIINTIVSDTNGQGASTLENVLGILFMTHDTNKSNDGKEIDVFADYNGEQEVYGKLLGDVVIKLVGTETFDVVNDKKLYIKSAIKAIINHACGYSMESVKSLLELIKKAGTNEMVKKIYDLFGDTEWEKFSKDILGYLYDNDNAKLNISLKKAFNMKIWEIPGMFTNLIPTSDSSTKESKEGKFDNVKSYASEFFANKTIKGLVEEINTSIPDDTPAIKFTSISNFFKSLADNDTLQNALNGDLTKLLDNLGLNDDGSTRVDTPFSYLYTFLNDNAKLISGILKIANNYIETMKSDIKVITDAFVKIRNDISVTYTISSTQFTYKVTYKEKTSNFKIKVASNGDKDYISSIS